MTRTKLVKQSTRMRELLLSSGVPVAEVTQQAEVLVTQSEYGGLARYLVPLAHQAGRDPQRVAALVLALADMVTESTDTIVRPSDDGEDHAAYLRAAHAAHNRGERGQWVRDGEREYQRRKARRRRTRLATDDTEKVA